ncbi:MAG TPA: hypothetical protein VGO07_06470 [Candidatus Saccharimonadales bacterium]|jgi:hypothetical protein|nr:hypothetical protein [Candidatus Saccharimonadales bacterium]
MSEHYERRSSSALSAIVISVALGSILVNVGRALEDAPGQVKDVQIRNEQLHDQLDGAHTVRGLIIDPEETTFRFNTTDPNEQAEICTGKYEVKNNAATVVGDLACTQVVPGPAGK